MEKQPVAPLIYKPAKDLGCDCLASKYHLGQKKPNKNQRILFPSFFFFFT